MIRAIELTENQFTLVEQEITAILKHLKGFTSPTYQSKGIPTVNDKVLLLEPKQQIFIDAIKPLDITFKDLGKSIIKVQELTDEIQD